MRTLQPLVGEPVRSIQTFLRKISESRDIPKVIPDGIYGNSTRRAVEAFQLLYGLPTTGEADFDTWNKIVEVFDEVTAETAPPARFAVFPEGAYIIETGDEDELLFVLQSAIKVISGNIENVPDLDINGVHDDKSVEAVKEIQRIAGIEDNGRINKETANAIADVYEFYVVKKHIFDKSGEMEGAGEMTTENREAETASE